MSFSSEVKEELRNKSFTSKKRNSRISNVGLNDYRNRICDAFLNCGSISDPGKCYLLEMVFQDADTANEMAELLSRLDFYARVTYRKDSYVTYISDADSISDILNLIGAHKSLLAFENMRIYKSMRENVQRIVNCETANLQKTVSASVRQIEDIEFIQQNAGFDCLPDNLKDIAVKRLELPGATLQELADSLDPPLGKSGVNHRLRRLTRIAEDLRSRKQEV